MRPWMGVQLVVPRSLCTYLRLDAAGVPLRRLRSFVELQVAGQSPFQETGFFAMRMGVRFHVWLWDQRLLNDAVIRHGLSGERVRAVPSSMLGPRLKDGGAFFWTMPGMHGIEAQLWEGRKLAFSAWFPARPGPEEWRGWRHEIEAREGVTWPADRPMQRQDPPAPAPWARNFASNSQLAAWPKQRLVPVMLGALTTVLLAYGAWVYGQIVANEQVIQLAEAPVLDDSQRSAQQQKVKALDAQRWVQDVSALRGEYRMTDLMRALSPVLAAEGLLLREIDVQGMGITATLRPTREFKIASVIERLENAGLFENARLLDAANGALRVSWRIRDSQAFEGSPAISAGSPKRATEAMR